MDLNGILKKKICQVNVPSVLIKLVSKKKNWQINEQRSFKVIVQKRSPRNGKKVYIENKIISNTTIQRLRLIHLLKRKEINLKKKGKRRELHIQFNKPNDTLSVL